LAVYNGDITKFLWGDASPPQLFGRGGDRPHGVGAYDPYSALILFIQTLALYKSLTYLLTYIVN